MITLSEQLSLYITGRSLNMTNQNRRADVSAVSQLVESNARRERNNAWLAAAG
jgi:hypothetical protein